MLDFLKTLIISSIILLNGCLTIQQPNLPEPPINGAIYRTADGTYTVENTTSEEFCNQMVNNSEIIEGVYSDEDITKLSKPE